MLHLHWVEIHAGINHLPFAFLLVIPIFEIGAIFFHKEEWRIVSFWLLVAAVVALFPTLITGWITGDALKITGGAARPPELFIWHRLLAFITAGLALILLIWRISAHDQLRGKKYAASFALSVIIAAAVGVTGFMGGRMVLGSGEQSTFVPLKSASPQVLSRIPNLDPKQIAAGQKLFVELPCQSCHTMNGSGGIAGPNLTHEALRHNDPAWHIAHLKDPSKMSPDSGMPSFDYLKPEELKALAAYLATRK
jgi:uncharacterized membrane protein/cytochrome c2